MNTTLSSSRRYDLDWMRVIAILTVFLFHSCRFFDLGGWHVKNPERYLSVQIWVAFLSMWIMPFIFVISGASLYYAMNKGGFGTFLKDKTLRLLVPLVLGCFTHIALQVYYERTTQSGFTGSFFDFYPRYFDGWYAFGGNFAWMGLHLWYLLMLFLFSLLLYPLFRWIKSRKNVASLPTEDAQTSSSGGAIARLYLLALPVMAVIVALDPATFAGMKGFGGWPLPAYIVFFLYGFLIMRSAALQTLIARMRRVSLAAGVAGFAALMMLWFNGGDPKFGTIRYAVIFGIWGLSSWSFVIALFGFGFRLLTRSTPFLRYANEAVLPFYILHQTVLLTFGFFIVYWPINDAVKFALIAAASFATVMLIYEFCIRRFTVMRILFGMKPAHGKQLLYSHDAVITAAKSENVKYHYEASGTASSDEKTR